MKLEIGKKMPNFNVDTAFKRGVYLKELLSHKKTVILFLRYAGCTLCRFDMLILKNEYKKITEVSGKVLVVLQSNPDKLSNEIGENFYPYDIICDPNEELYKKLEIKAANSHEEMIGPDSIEKLKKVEESGLTHGEYEGNEMQLPAIFIVNKDLEIQYSHYSANITDIPNVDELANLLK